MKHASSPARAETARVLSAVDHAVASHAQLRRELTQPALAEAVERLLRSAAPDMRVDLVGGAVAIDICADLGLEPYTHLRCRKVHCDCPEVRAIAGVICDDGSLHPAGPVIVFECEVDECYRSDATGDMLVRRDGGLYAEAPA